MSRYTRPCANCTCSSDWHSFKEERNPSRSVTDDDAVFTCNGPEFNGCPTHCPLFRECLKLEEL